VRLSEVVESDKVEEEDGEYLRCVRLFRKVELVRLSEVVESVECG
jgi:hypothetical protein